VGGTYLGHARTSEQRGSLSLEEDSNDDDLDDDLLFKLPPPGLAAQGDIRGIGVESQKLGEANSKKQQRDPLPSVQTGWVKGGPTKPRMWQWKRRDGTIRYSESPGKLPAVTASPPGSQGNVKDSGPQRINVKANPPVLAQVLPALQGEGRGPGNARVDAACWQRGLSTDQSRSEGCADLLSAVQSVPRQSPARVILDAILEAALAEPKYR